MRAGLAVIAVVVVLFATCNRNPPSEQSMMDRLVEAETQGSRLIAVPNAPPGPYRLEAVEMADVVDGQRVLSRWRYRQTEESKADGALPDVEVCVLRRSAVNLCPPEAREALVVQRLSGGRRVFVYAVGPQAASALSYWEDAEFTTNWRDETWLLQ